MSAAEWFIVGIVIWCAFVGCALLLVRMNRDEPDDDAERVDSIRAELDIQEERTKKVRAL